MDTTYRYCETKGSIRTTRYRTPRRAALAVVKHQRDHPIRYGNPQPAIDWYQAHITDVADGYEQLDPAGLYEWIRDILPEAPSRILDIGAGTGRDAAWLAGLGHDVTAVEPSRAMRTHGQKLHADSPIRWVNDRLPELKKTQRKIRQGKSKQFDAAIVNAVWMHIIPQDGALTFSSLAKCLKPGGLLVISLRQGPTPPERHMHDWRRKAIERLATRHGAEVLRRAEADDQRERPDLHWTQIAIRTSATKHAG